MEVPTASETNPTMKGANTMEHAMLSPSDVALLNDRDGNDWGGNGSFFWVFALLLLAGGGLGWNNNRDNVVTEADLCTSQNFQNVQNTLGQIKDMGYTQSSNIFNAISTLGYQELQNLNGVNQNLMNRSYEMQQSIDNCCCTTQRAIDGVNYNVANQTAAINANTTAQVQKVLDAIAGNRMADMQNQINALQLQNAMCGVVRYPQSSTYYAGNNPFYNTNYNYNQCC